MMEMHCLDSQIKRNKKRIISKTKIKGIIKIQKIKYWIVKKNSINERGCVRSGNNVRVT